MTLPFEVSKCVLFGIGTIGFAIASRLSLNSPNLPLTLVDPDTVCVQSINKTHLHPYFHKGVLLPTHVTCTDDVTAVKGANLIILCIPGQFVRTCVRDFAPHITCPVIILNVAKALEKGTNLFLHTVIEEEWRTARRGRQAEFYFATLAGGLVAEEVTHGWPIAADLACQNLMVAKHVRSILSSPNFKIRVTDDVIGVELAGAFKNVLAIGAGLFDGLNLALSSKVAYLCEASREMRNLAVMLGANPNTFGLGSHAWMADLLASCFGPGRNRQLGEMIGSGMKVSEALEKLESMRKRAEGYHTTKAFYNLAKRRGIEMPFLQTLTEVLFEEKPVKQAIEDFFRGIDIDQLTQPAKL